MSNRLAELQARVRAQKEAAAAAAAGPSPAVRSTSIVPPAAKPATAAAAAAGLSAKPTAPAGAPAYAGPRSLAKPKLLAKPTSITTSSAPNSANARTPQHLPPARSSSNPAPTPPLTPGAAAGGPATVTKPPPKRLPPASSLPGAKPASLPTGGIPIAGAAGPATAAGGADGKSTLKRKKTTAPTASDASHSSAQGAINWNPTLAILNATASASSSLDESHQSKKPKLTGVSLANTSHLTKLGLGSKHDRVDRHLSGCSSAKPAEEKTTLWVENVAEEATTRDLTAVFGIYGDIVDCRLQPASCYPRRCGLVRFRLRDACEIAREMLHATSVAGSEIVLSYFDSTHHRLEDERPVDESDALMLIDAEEGSAADDQAGAGDKQPQRPSQGGQGGRKRLEFLKRLHAWKPHIAAQAQAFSAAMEVADAPKSQRACYTLGPFPSAAAVDKAAQIVLESCIPPADNQPTRELIMYDLIEY